MKSFLSLTVAALLLLIVPTAPHAADDHGHDHGEVPAASAAPAQPRFSAESDAFELVGVLQGRTLTLYLDRFADNTPVDNAQLEVEVGDEKLVVKPTGAGVYEAVFAAAPPSGVSAVTVALVAGDETDLVAAELDLHADAHADDEHAEPHGTPWSAWTTGGALAAGVLIGALGMAALRRRSAAPGSAA